MDMKESKLLACPFCRSKAKYTICTVNDKHENFVQCSGCHVHSPVFIQGENAIIWWNTRTPQFPDPCTPEQWEEITGKKFPDTGAVWCYYAMEYLGPKNWYLKYYIIAKDTEWPMFIVKTGKPAPPADWKLE